MSLSAADHAELEEQPWLQPFVEDDDTSLDGARERYYQAMSACRAEIRAAGRVLHERVVTSNGLETTALRTHPTKVTP